MGPVGHAVISAGKKILVICLSNSWGGLEQVAVDDTLALSDAGLKMAFLCLEGSPVHENLRTYSEKIQIEALGFRPRNFMDLRLRSTLQELIHSGVGIIHTHQTTLLGSIVPWILSSPQIGLIATRHIMNNHNKRDLYHRTLYSRVDFFLVMSEALRTNVSETHSLSQAHIKTIQLGLDFSRFDPKKVDRQKMRARWNLRKDELVIGMVGRIDPAKGQETLLQAAAKLRDEGFRVKIIIVGEETKGSPEGYLQALQRLTDEYQLQDSVIFEGFHKDIPDVMAGFDILVMPSREEAFGLVAIEAMAMQVPVVISNRGSAKEIVGSHEEFGLLFRPGDAFDLRRAIKILMEDPGLREQMGLRARTHVLQKFNKERRTQKTLEVYDRVLRRRSVAG